VNRGWVTAALLAMLLMGTVLIGVSAIAPLIVDFARVLGGDEVTATSIQTLGYIVATLVPPFAGALADRWGRGNTFTLGGILAGLFFLVFGRVTTLPQAYVVRSAIALGTGVVLPAVMAYIQEVAPADRRGMAMGFYGLGFGMGGIFGPVLATSLGAVDPSRPFFAWGLVTIPLVLLLGLAARSREPRVERVVSSRRGLGQVPAVVTLPLVAAFLFGGIQLCMFTFVTQLVRYQIGAEVAYGGLAIAVFATIGLLQPLGGLVADRMGRVRVTAVGFAILAIGMAMVYGWPTLPGLFAGMVLGGAGAVFFSPGLVATMGSLVPVEVRGMNMGLYQAATTLGSALVPLAVAFFVRTAQPSVAFAASAVMALAAGALILPLRRHKAA